MTRPLNKIAFVIARELTSLEKKNQAIKSCYLNLNKKNWLKFGF